MGQNTKIKIIFLHENVAPLKSRYVWVYEIQSIFINSEVFLFSKLPIEGPECEDGDVGLLLDRRINESVS